MVVDLRDFEINAARTTARIWITKTVYFDENTDPVFPIAEAKAIAQQLRLVEKLQQSLQFKDTLKPLFDEDNE